MTRELNKITKAITEWDKKNNNDVSFIGSFVSFNKKGMVVDNKIIGYGGKGTIEIQLKDIIKMVKKEKEFINW